MSLGNLVMCKVMKEATALRVWKALERDCQTNTLFSRIYTKYHIIPLFVLACTSTGKFKLIARNDSVVLCKSCGGILGDPYQGIAIKNGYSSLIFASRCLCSYFSDESDESGETSRSAIYFDDDCSRSSHFDAISNKS